MYWCFEKAPTRKNAINGTIRNRKLKKMTPFYKDKRGFVLILTHLV